jgi:NAD(P)-dependent dehydrogenase (short-subunit alcohol dehydrogenase family)
MMPGRRRFLQFATAGAALPVVGGCGPDKSRSASVPASPFDDESTADEVTEGLDLKGRIAVVTGCTSGIGFETMRVLAGRGAYVLGTSRSRQRAEDACRSVRGVTTPLQLDLADQDSIIECADDIRSLKSPIDLLICNAGYRGGGNERQLVNGLEKHFAINHLGHFLLVNRVLDRLFFANQGRIVIVASRTSYTDAPADGIKFNDLAFDHAYSDARAYGHSKLANVLFANGLARRLRGTRITANSLHPGVIDTEIDRNMNPVTQFLFGVVTAVSGKSVEQGAATSCYVATSPVLGAVSGEYFEDCNAVRISDSHLHDEAMADRLWELSELRLGEKYVNHERPDWREFHNGLRRPSPRDSDRTSAENPDI